MSRIPYDLIGGAWTHPAGGSLSYCTAAQLRQLNDPSDNTTIATFPEDDPSFAGVYFSSMAFDLVGYNLRYVRQNNYALGAVTIYTSVDTTDGQDGTWVNQGTGVHSDTNEMTALAVSGIKGFKITQVGQSAYSAYLKEILLWGTPVVTGNPDVVAFWDETSDQAMADDHFEATTYPNDVVARSFRLKNLSSSLTASTITVTADVLNDADPSLDYEIEFGTTGTYTPTTKTFTYDSPEMDGCINFLRTFPGMTAVGASVASGHTGERAINGDGNTSQCELTSTNPNYWTLDLGANATIDASHFGILMGNNNSYVSENFKIQGSNNGSAWTDLHTQSTATGVGAYQWWTTPLTPGTAYRYFRLEKLDGVSWMIAEVEIWGEVDINLAHEVTVSSLTAGSISSVLNYRVSKRPTSELGIWQPRVVVDVGSWA